MLLRVRQDKRSRARNDADLLLRVRYANKSRVKNDADLLLRGRQNKKSRGRMAQTCCLEKDGMRKVE